MQRLIVLMAAMSMVAWGGAMAADKVAEKTPEKIVAVTAAPESKEKQMEKLGALRGRLMIKLDELRKTVDGNQNGAGAAYGAVQGVQTKVNQAVSKQVQEENAKAQEMRNQALVDTLNKKSQKNNEMWNEFNQKEWTTYNKTMAEQNQVCGSLRQIFGNIADIEMAWSNSGIDLEMLIGVMSAIEKRSDEVKVKATAAVADMTAAVAVWEAFSKE